jgi:hypothetical protein
MTLDLRPQKVHTIVNDACRHATDEGAMRPRVYERGRTATLATFFIDRDADRPGAALAGERSIDALHRRLDALQQLLDARLPPSA